MRQDELKICLTIKKSLIKNEREKDFESKWDENH